MNTRHDALTLILTFNLLFLLIPVVAAQQPTGKKADKKATKQASEAKEEEETEKEKREKPARAHPLVAEIELALNNGQLIAPAGSCAWDLYQILATSVPNEPAIKPLAEKLLNALIAPGTEPLNLYLQGVDRFFQREDWANAQQFIVRARELQNDNKELKLVELFYQGMIALADRQPAKAEELFRQGLKQNNNAAYLHNALGRALSDQRKDDEAIKEYTQASTLAPQWTYPLVNIAIKYQRRGELEMAKRSAQAALNINIGDVEAHALLAAIHTSQGNNEEAIREYQIVVISRPGSVADRVSLGCLFLERGDYVAAEESFRAARQINPLDARARLYHSIAIQRAARSEFENALAQLQAATTPSSDDSALKLTLAIAAIEQGNYNDAIDAYRAVLKSEPWQINIQLQVARLLVLAGRANESLEEYRAILKKNPASKEAHNGLGLALKKAGELKDAIAEYRKALTLDINYVEARYNLASILQEKGEFEAAANEYRTVLNIDPAHSGARTALKEIEEKLGPPKSAN
ncbi:MAG: tetratricopeptide repeat protein [Acidobacteriota bacterium]